MDDFRRTRTEFGNSDYMIAGVPYSVKVADRDDLSRFAFLRVAREANAWSHHWGEGPHSPDAAALNHAFLNDKNDLLLLHSAPFSPEEIKAYKNVVDALAYKRSELRSALGDRDASKEARDQDTTEAEKECQRGIAFGAMLYQRDADQVFVRHLLSSPEQTRAPTFPQVLIDGLREYVRFMTNRVPTIRIHAEALDWRTQQSAIRPYLHI